MTGRRQRERRATEAEVDLWRRAVAEAKPLPGRKAPPPPAAVDGVRPAPAARPARRPPTDPPALASPIVPNSPLARPLDRATHTRLRRGRLPIEGRIDLHGMTAAEARRNLATFLRASQAMGHRAVLVITGRGRDPDRLGRGVLKREAPHWLDGMKDIVAGYGQADRRHGGDGALYVQLRRKDKAGPS